jgi:DNA replication protein DnaC
VNITGSENFLFAIDHVYAVIKEYPKNKNTYGLYLYGRTGTGKTLLSCIILNEMIRLYQIPVKYAKISRDILGKIRDTFNPQSEYYGEGRKIEEELANIEILVIDDFGVQKDSPWVNNVLYDLIDSRYEKNLLTILTSNEPMDSWKEISNGRVFSRLKEMCLEIHLDAEDYRLKKSKSIH